jgi:hypothetical protein
MTGDTDWMAAAACRTASPNLFFPQRGDPQHATAAAKAVCDTCPVRDACLDYALATSQKHGIWGGMSERQRRGLRIARNRGGLHERTCAWCRTPFTTSNPLVVTCGTDCYRLRRREQRNGSRRRNAS